MSTRHRRLDQVTAEEGGSAEDEKPHSPII
jgi:hypothetical protein